MPMPTTVPFDALCSHWGRDLPQDTQAVYVRGQGMHHESCVPAPVA